jgi:hypothetical protein
LLQGVTFLILLSFSPFLYRLGGKERVAGGGQEEMGREGMMCDDGIWAGMRYGLWGCIMHGTRGYEGVTAVEEHTLLSLARAFGKCGGVSGR